MKTAHLHSQHPTPSSAPSRSRRRPSVGLALVLLIAAGIGPAVGDPAALRRIVDENMRRLEDAARRGLQSSADCLRPFAPTRLEAWRQAALDGLLEGQCLYGICLEAGLGVEKDPVQAVAWYRKAAENGNHIAQNSLGVCYDQGIGVEKDPVQAVAWYRKAAEQGNARAQINLGFCYVDGTGVEKDPLQAVAWFRKAAEQGNAAAQCILGVCYADGTGVEKDPVQAVTFFYRAAEQGNARAQYHLGMCYAYGLGVGTDMSTSAAWLRKAAEQGEAAAQFYLARCFENGVGVTKDLAQAFYWISKAAEQGAAAAQCNLGVCYAAGTGVEKDPLQAVAWYRKAAEQGNAIAHKNLANLFIKGEGVVQDDVQGCAHFLIALALGEKSVKENVDVLRFQHLAAAEYAAAQKVAEQWLGRFRARADKRGEDDFSDGPSRNPTLSPRAGTGFAISDDGYFLTCAHVVKGGRTIKVLLGSVTHSARLIRADERNDVALLKLEGTGFKPLALAPTPPEMGDKVFTVGFPNPEFQGAAAKYTDGAVSSLSGLQDDIRTMQITVPVQGGNSGGALADESGNVVGIVVAQLNAAKVFEYTDTIPQNVNFAVKINYAMPLIQSVPSLSRDLPQARAASPNARPVDVVQAATGLVLASE